MNVANENEIYPTISFKISSEIERKPNGKFVWAVEIHEQASDSFTRWQSDAMDSKKDITLKMLAEFPKKLEELYNELEP